MARSGFKMKGSPMQRNFGISPLNKGGKTSGIGKLKSAAYAIKRGFTNPTVETVEDVYRSYKSAKRRHREDPSTYNKPLSQKERDAAAKKE